MASSNEVLVGKVLNSVVDHVNIQVTSTLNKTAGLVLASVQAPSAFDIVTRSRNFTTDSRLNLWMKGLLDQSIIPGVNTTIIYCQRKNLTNDAPPDAPNYMKVNVWWNRYSVFWCDYQNYTDCFMCDYDPITGVAGPPYPQAWIKPYMLNDTFTCAIQRSCPQSGGIWNAELLLGYLWLTFATCAPPVPKFGPTAPYSTSFPISAGDLIKEIFQKLTPSENSRLFLINASGDILAGNALTSVANAANDGFISAIKANDTSTAQLAYDIKQRTSSYTSMSAVVGSLLETTIAAEKWTYSVRRLEVPTAVNIYLIAAIPRSDLFSVIDDAQRTSITVTIVFAVVSMIVVVLVTIGITLPVRTLTGEMSKVASFDFSMLERGFFVENSVFAEIRNMQRTFNTLVKAFAGAIAKNKGLSNKTSSMGSSAW
ncbi:hypothetical protein BJ742DRAFT_852855 [Cladochytrium replicatum]|nr:hypothetical protein BJ742DRAFT_852855 [Cladochytrium replicatum]